MMLEKNFEVKKVLKGGKLSYMQVFPNNKDGKTLFIYNTENIGRQYIPIDDERTCVLDYDKFEDACKNDANAMTELLTILGEEVNTYYTIDNYTFENFFGLVQYYDLDLPLCAIDVLHAGYSIITRDNHCIKEKHMTEMQFNELYERTPKEVRECAALR